MLVIFDRVFTFLNLQCTFDNC